MYFCVYTVTHVVGDDLIRKHTVCVTHKPLCKYKQVVYFILN